MKETIAQSVAEVQEHVIVHRRTLHQIPEGGLELPQTADYVRQILTELGCDPQNIGTCGQVVTLGQGERTLLLRADMDALPMKEEKDLDFRSENGYGHMCGHDSHAAMLLGAARILKEMEDELEGTVKLMFQPGEETGAGARILVENGVLENPKPDAAFGLHVQSVDPTGQVGYAVGVNSSYLETFIV